MQIMNVRRKVALLLVAGWAALASHEHLSAQEAGHGEEHAEHGRYGIGLFVGGTHAESEHLFTLGVEAGINLNANWSVGAVAETTERGKRSSLFLAGLGWHPWGPGLRFQLGAGIKDPSGEHEGILRTGITYEVAIGHGWFVKPYLAWDFIRDHDAEAVYGAYVGRVF
jgi:hypothetical protein